ncbi:MAG: CHASE domain-containing protein [Nitrospirae bacterium]|nr:CHASE domain-containing protein [Nitrospirota bacterium]
MPFYKKLHYVVFIICILSTLLVWYFSSSYIRQQAKQRFLARTGQITDQLVERMYANRTILRGAAALFDASDDVTRKDWRTYVESLRIHEHYPGIQGIGFSQFIKPSELRSHISKIRSEGFPNYTVRPEGDRQGYTSIIYLEPFDERNQRAFGYDMFSEPVRRRAMERSRDTNTTVITSKVKLVQETEKDVQNGFLMYVPVYKKSMPVNDEQERRLALSGYVYSPFRIKDLMNALFKGALLDVDLEIYDGNEISIENKLYDSNNDGYGLSKDSHRSFIEKKVVNMHGHKWTLVYSPLEPFVLASESYLPAGVIPIGLIISFSLALLMWLQERSREQALAMAALGNEMRLLLEASGEGIYGIDLNGCCTFINNSALKMLGYDLPEDLLGRNMHDMIHHSRNDGSPYPVDECPIFIAFKIGEACSIEDEVFWRKDGTAFYTIYSSNPLFEKGAIKGAVVTFSDITERKLAEERILELNTTLENRVLERTEQLNSMIDELQEEIDYRKKAEKDLTESEARYRQITKTVTDYIYTVSVENGVVVNTVHGEGCQSITGYLPDEFDSDQYLWLNMVFIDDRDEVLRRTKKILSGAAVPAIEHRIIKKDGALRWVRSTCVQKYDDKGRLQSYDGLIQDITERKLVESELLHDRDYLEKVVAERTKQLEEARDAAESANIAKSEFLANMSHELRTPLNSIIGFSEVLQDEFSGPLNEQQKDYLNDIRSSGKHLLSLINDILDLSKVEAGKMELELGSVHVREVLGHSLSMLKEKAVKGGIILKLDVAPDADIEIAADERKLKQIIFNLLSNAVKFTSNGGRVTVSARRVEDFIEIAVTDTGIGIKPEDIAKLFHEFSQLESTYEKKYEGSGLGLALTKRLVELHGGSIRLESEYGKGSSFVFKIPAGRSEDK